MVNCRGMIINSMSTAEITIMIELSSMKNTATTGSSNKNQHPNQIKDVRSSIIKYRTDIGALHSAHFPRWSSQVTNGILRHIGIGSLQIGQKLRLGEFTDIPLGKR